MKNLVIIAILLISSYSNAQFPTLEALGGGPNFRINGETFRVTDVPFANELVSLIDGTFDWTEVTSNTPNGFAFYTVSNDAINGLDVIVYRDGRSGMINITASTDEIITYHVSDQGQTYDGAYSGTTTHTSEPDARAQAQGIVDANGGRLYIYSIVSRSSRVIVTGTEHVLFENSLRIGEPTVLGSPVVVDLPPGDFSVFDNHADWTVGGLGAYLTNTPSIFVQYSHERGVYVLFFNGAPLDFQTQQGAIDHIANPNG